MLGHIPKPEAPLGNQHPSALQPRAWVMALHHRDGALAGSPLAPKTPAEILSAGLLGCAHSSLGERAPAFCIRLLSGTCLIWSAGNPGGQTLHSLLHTMRHTGGRREPPGPGSHSSQGTLHLAGMGVSVLWPYGLGMAPPAHGLSAPRDAFPMYSCPVHQAASSKEFKLVSVLSLQKKTIAGPLDLRIRN